MSDRGAVRIYKSTETDDEDHHHYTIELHGKTRKGELCFCTQVMGPAVITVDDQPVTSKEGQLRIVFCALRALFEINEEFSKRIHDLEETIDTAAEGIKGIEEPRSCRDRSPLR